MESLHNPPDTMLLSEYFETIGALTHNVTGWMSFHRAIVMTTAASSVGLLKQMREADVDAALTLCKLSIGYKSVCPFVSPPVPHTRSREIE